MRIEPKNVYQRQVTFMLNESDANEFALICTKNHYSKTEIFRKLVKSFIEDNKINKPLKK